MKTCTLGILGKNNRVVLTHLVLSFSKSDARLCGCMNFARITLPKGQSDIYVRTNHRLDNMSIFFRICAWWEYFYTTPRSHFHFEKKLVRNSVVYDYSISKGQLLRAKKNEIFKYHPPQPLKLARLLCHPRQDLFKS